MSDCGLDNLLLVFPPSILGMAPQQNLWVRTFTRDGGFDVDSEADASLLKVLSSDFSGWFLQQNANLDIDTLNKMVSIFWSTLKEIIFLYSTVILGLLAHHIHRRIKKYPKRVFGCDVLHR